MNKAFTKEADDAPLPPKADRPVSTAQNVVTPRGARLIEEHIAEIQKRLATDTDAAARSDIRRDLRYWLARQSTMQIVAQDRVTKTVGFGRRVTIRRGTNVVTITIVGEDEADPKGGLIAWTAPLARAIDGAKVGETVDLEVGRDEIVTILAIS